MTLRYARARYAIAALAAIGVVALPASANAWSWGYNYVGPSTNSTVVAGWNYWSSAYADKRSGGTLYHTWQGQGGNGCTELFSGVTTWGSTPGTCGVGGYSYSSWGYWSGDTSYVYFSNS